MDMQYKGVWAFIECTDGRATDGSLELLTPGRSLAQAAKAPLSAVVIGGKNRGALEAACAHGADRAYFIDGDAYDEYDTDCYTHALFRLIERHKPECLLLSGTTLGRDLAPRLAGRLKTGLVADCTALSFDTKRHRVIWTRPAYSGNLMADIVCEESFPQMGTIRPGVFPKPLPDQTPAELVFCEIEPPAEGRRVNLLSLIAHDRVRNDGPDMNSEIIVSMGRGAATPDGLDLICSLADALGAAIGASRAAVKEKIISEQYQVGQTGKTVGPKLYIACGISGSAQHLAGIGSAGCIVAINRDPKAPIFRYADYGIVGDLYEVIPALVEALEK